MPCSFRYRLFYTIAIALLCTLSVALPPHGISFSHSRRSLPGSLAVAPDGAIGYYEQPQEAKAQPMEIDIEPTRTSQEVTHELREAPVSGNDVINNG